MTLGVDGTLGSGPALGEIASAADSSSGAAAYHYFSEMGAYSMFAYLKQSTASQTRAVGPFVDDTDFKTLETGLTINNTDVKLSKNGGSSANKNSGGGTHIANGMYALTFDATDTNTVGELSGSISVSGALVVTFKFTILEEAIYDALFAASAAAFDANQRVDVGAISGDATAADNLELMYDGTGYTDDTAPASRSQVDGISGGSGGALFFENEADNIDSAIKSVTFVGVETSGTNASVHAEDGVYHVIDDTGNNIDIVYQFDIGGGRTANEIMWKGYLSSGNDVASIQAYDGSTWNTLATITGKGGTSNDSISIPLASKYTGTGSDLGKVFVRIIATAQSNPTLNTDLLLVSGINIGQSVGYANGAIWIDTGASNTNTEAFVDGVADNPVSTVAAANTLSASVGINRFEVTPDSSITFAATQTGEVWTGDIWTLALGGQDLAGTCVERAVNGVSGTCTGASPMIFVECSIQAVTAPPSYYDRCGIASTFTMGSAGDFYFVDCFSQIAGASSPTIDMGAAIGGSNLSVRRWSGGLTLNNLASGDVVTLDGVFGTITLNGADAQVEIRGIAKAVVNNLTGSPTVNDNTVKSDDLITAAEVNAEVVDAIATDTYGEPSQGAPGATISLTDKVSYLYKAWRNKIDNDGSTTQLYDDAGSTVDHKQTTSESAGTVTKGEWTSGP